MPEHTEWKQELAKRLDGSGLEPAREAEIVEELAAHLEDDYQKLLASGASEDEAREIALEGLTDRRPLADEIRGIERRAPIEPVIPESPGPGNVVAAFWRDFRYALRMLKRNPGFTALAILSLALGIGGNAAMFSIVSTVLIRPLPYPAADRLVQADKTGYYPPGGLVDLQQESRTMDIAGFIAGTELNLTGQGEPWRVRGSSVSANLFSVLAARMELGRPFRHGEDRTGQDNVVILSHALWKTRFGGDREIAGRVITLGGIDRQVVGVAGPGFAFPDAATMFWIPLHLDPRDVTATWSKSFMPVVARLRTGVTLGQAKREIQSLSRNMIKLYPYAMGRNFNAEATVVPLQEFITTDLRTRLIVLQCAVGLVLLIACTNVAGLLLARAASRQKEMALRVALGAARGAIVRQLLTESVVLSFAGGALGIGLAYGAFSVLRSVMPATGRGWSEVQLGWQMLVFVSVLALATGVAFGLIPALSAARQNIAAVIRTGGQRAGGAVKARLRSALIIGEVALAVVLTVSAGLLIRSLWMLAQVNPGFRPQQLLTLRVSPNQSVCRDRGACLALYNELLRRVREIPGVEDAAAANTLPLAPNFPSTAVKIEGLPYVPAERTAPMFWAGAVTPDYFRVMGIPILRGRPFTDADRDHAAPVVIVNASTARRYWPGENPIGKHVQLVWEDTGRRVVGVAADVRQFNLANNTPDFVVGAMYMPYAQSFDNDRQLTAAMTLIVHTRADTDRVTANIRQLVGNLNPNVPVSEIRAMIALVDDSTQQSRSMMWLFVAFAGVALVLAAVGAYGVVSYTTTQRTFEIGLRVALGARRSSIFGMILGQSMRLVSAGLLLGIAVSLALTRMLTAFLYGTAATDPLTFLAVCILLIAVALLAGFVPARRAAGVDPLIALRTE